MFQNEDIIKGTITTNSISSGLLNPEQAKQFIKQTPLASAVRHEMRRARTGYIDKIGIAKRIVRKKVENTDDGYRATVTPSQVEYKTTAIRLPWEITRPRSGCHYYCNFAGSSCISDRAVWLVWQQSGIIFMEENPWTFDCHCGDRVV